MVIIRNILRSYRILILAIFISFCWHIFWLSAIKIVVTPDQIERVKFSKVYFLGPILDKTPIEVRAQPKGLSLLEKRYMDSAIVLPGTELGKANSLYVPGRDLSESAREALTNLIDESLGGSKLEPAPLT